MFAKSLGRSLGKMIVEDCKRPKIYAPPRYGITDVWEDVESGLRSVDLALYGIAERITMKFKDLMTIESMFGESVGLWWKMRRMKDD